MDNIIYIILGINVLLVFSIVWIIYQMNLNSKQEEENKKSILDVLSKIDKGIQFSIAKMEKNLLEKLQNEKEIIVEEISSSSDSLQKNITLYQEATTELINWNGNKVEVSLKEDLKSLSDELKKQKIEVFNKLEDLSSYEELK